jgi:hypothetical protein
MTEQTGFEMIDCERLLEKSVLAEIEHAQT